MPRAWGFLLVFACTNASLVLVFPFTLPRFALAAAVYASGTILMVAALFHPTSQLLVANRSTVPTRAGSRALALTFDDGPWPETTPRLLAILRERNVKAAFFVVGRQAERYPALVRKIVDDGHVVGNHTYSHPALFCLLVPARLRGEIARAQQAIEAAAGTRPRYFRSPVGMRHPMLSAVLEEAGLEYISWRLRTYDTREQPPGRVKAKILESAVPGDIVLLHDRPGAGPAAMLSVLPEVLDTLRDRGYDFVLP